MIATRPYVLVTLALFTFFLSACSGPLINMQPVSEEMAVAAPVDGKSLVIFMRPSLKESNIQSSVHLADESGPSLIGIVAANKKVSFETDPGKFLFMVVGENADFLSAELLANKTYYVLIAEKTGGLEPDFTLNPIRYSELDSDIFNRWLSECEWVENTPNSEAWARSKRAEFGEKYEKYYPQWKAKDKQSAAMLLPGDGI